MYPRWVADEPALVMLRAPKEVLIWTPNAPGGGRNWHNDASHLSSISMKRTSFSDDEFASKKRLRRRDRFLAEMGPCLAAQLREPCGSQVRYRGLHRRVLRQPALKDAFVKKAINIAYF